MTQHSIELTNIENPTNDNNFPMHKPRRRRTRALAAALLIAFSVSTAAAAAPAMADDTEQVQSAVNAATSEHHIDSYTMSNTVINDQGTLYLPLRSVLNILGATITDNPDNQDRKLKLTTRSGDTQLYYNEDKTAIATSANGTYYPIKTSGDVAYVSQAFIQALTNRVVSVNGATLMLIKTDASLPVWKTLEAYSVDEAYVVEEESARDQIVASAMQYLGVPYVWGGTSPSGFDCSGLVQYVYAQNGISIPRTTYTQINAGTRISLSELQPGDLVFWGGSSPHHVGIYIGDGQYIHAPAPGQTVKIQSVNQYAYDSAVRILD